MDSESTKVRLQEALTSLKVHKNEKIELEKLVLGLKDDNHKARGSVLALTMEIENVREKMGETKERLEVENEGMKVKLGRADAERQQLFLDNDDLRRRIATKENEVNAANAQISTLDEKLEVAKSDVASHVKTGVQAVHDARDHGFEEGCEYAKKEMRETVSKMQNEVKEMVEEIIQSEKNREAVQEEMAEHDAAFKTELDKLHAQLDLRADEVLKLKAIIGEKETEIIEVVRDKSRVEKDLKVVKSKYEFQNRTKDEVVHQAHDEVEFLRKRTMSLEKDLARTDKTKKQWEREARKATKQSKNDMKKALGIVKTHVAAGAPEELALDLEHLLGVNANEDNDGETSMSLSGSEMSSIGGISTPGSMSIGTPGSRRSKGPRSSLEFGGTPPSSPRRGVNFEDD
jgi:chromosome segregation ATPase